MGTCCICKKGFKGHGNNAEPIKKGTCCDKCNSKFVIPSRILDIELINKKERTQKFKELQRAAKEEGEVLEKIRN